MNSEARKYEMDMCSGPVLRKLLAFAVPLMLSSMLQLLFNAADVIVVGRFAGDNSLAAVGSNTALINLLTNLFMGLSVGANVTAARFYGAKQERELSRTVHTAMTLSVISGIVLTILGIIGAEQMLIWMQTPQKVLELSAVYLRIYFVGMTATMVYNFGSAILRAVGDTKRPLYYLLVSGILNLVLNLIFVILFKMDVAGVALATVISQTLSAFLVVRCLMKEEGGIKLELKKLCVDKSKLALILKIGLPAGFQGVVFSLSNVVIQSSINSFGEIVIAGNSAAQSVEGFVYMAMNAFHQAVISFVSQNFGAGKYERINKIVVVSELCVIAVGLILGNLACLCGNTLLGFYSDSQPVIEAGLLRLKYICTFYFLCGMMDVMVGALRGIGHSVMPMIVSLVGVCGIRLAWIAAVFPIEQYHTIETVYFSYLISWFFTTLIHVVCYVFARRHIRKKYEMKPAQEL